MLLPAHRARELVLEKDPVAGSYSSAMTEAPSPSPMSPPAISTLPLVSSTAVGELWFDLRYPAKVNVPVEESYSSAELRYGPGSCGLPLVIKTLPLGIKVAVS